MKQRPRISDYLLLAWVVLLPLQTRWFLHQGHLAGGFWEYGTLSLFVTDILLLAAFVVACFQERGLGQRPRSVPRSVVAGAIAVVLAIAFSTINAFDAGVAFGALLRVALGLVAWWLVLRSRMPLSWFAVGILASASIESIVIFFQFVQQSVPASSLFGLAAHSSEVAGDVVVESTFGRFLRGYGTLPHPNIAAGWLAFALVLASGVYLRSKDRLERALVLVAFCLVSAGLFLTFSRSGLLSWFAVLLVLVSAVLIRERWLGRPHWHFGFRRPDLALGLKMMKLVAASVLLLGVFLAIFSPLVKGRSDGSNRLEAKSVGERVAQIDESRAIIGKYWLFGVGIGNYTKALYETVDATRSAWSYQPVHNVPLLIVAELGTLGAILIVWYAGVLLALIFRQHRLRWPKDQAHDVPWIAPMSISLLLLVLLSLFDHFLWSLSFGVMMTWLVFGLWAKSLSEE